MIAHSTNIQDVLGRGPVHPFPARMAPGLVLDAMKSLKASATIVDPMVGSGTVLAIARSRGFKGIGFDVDPLAVLLSKTWTQTLDSSKFRAAARRVLIRARLKAETLTSRSAYPRNSDAETRKFVRYWFDPYSRKQLTALADAISCTTESSIKVALWCAFSRLIISKQAGASLAMDLSHSRPHRKFRTAPKKPFNSFLIAAERVIEGAVTVSSTHVGPITRIRLGDARRLPLANSSVDLVFTSPPYLNAIDYLRCSKFSLVWMGHTISELRGIRATSIGAEIGADTKDFQRRIYKNIKLTPPLSPRTKDILNQYLLDTRDALAETRRILVRRGRAVFVVGENTIRGTFIPTGKIIAMVAEEVGLTVASRRVRVLPDNRRYLPPPGKGRNALDTRMRREVILTFVKRPRSL